MRVAWAAAAVLVALAGVASAAQPSTPDAAQPTDSKRILALLPMPAKSHHIFFTALLKGLLQKGHKVTLVSPLTPTYTHPNQRFIRIENFLDILMKSSGNATSTSFDALAVGHVGQQFLLWGLGKMLCNITLSNTEVVALKNDKHDLVITEAFFFQEPMLGFAHHYKVPSIALNPFGFTLWQNDLTGGSINPSYVPSALLWMTDHMTFFERIINTVFTLFGLVGYYTFYYPTQNALLHEVFPDAPPLVDLVKDVSLTLLNNQAALNFPIPLAPSVVEVGGLHIQPEGKPLPPDMKKWLDASPDGFVYFSMGTNLKANEMPQEKVDHLMKAFGTLKQRVLLKWNADPPANAPANCRFESWVPQMQILAHPKLRVFVTHGGMLSTMEAVFFGVPVVGIPIYGDQFMNMVVAEKKGLGVMVSYENLTLSALGPALDEVLHNPRYREQTKKVSAQFVNQPLPPLEKALTYIDLLFKWGGNTDHLKPGSLDLRWWQLILLDVFAAIFLGLYIFYRLIRTILCLISSCLCGSGAKPKKAPKRSKQE